MNPLFLAIAVFLPIAFGILVALLPIKNRKIYLALTMAATILTSALVWALILNKPEGSIDVFFFVERIDIAFKMDGLSMVFAGLISVLWPFAVLYSFEYMEHESKPGMIREKTFFAMYIVTYGVTLGIAFSENMMSMYCFYEMLTLVTVPLVLFTLTKEAVRATRTYLFYSLGGAAFGFIALIFVIVYGDTIDFRFGGVLNMDLIGNRVNILRLIYVLGFMGFGVKAAVCPLNSWLPKAGVAPTPVTALLHAVAVVKSGAFAITRLTYYSFGTDIIKGSWAQYVVMAVAMITILYGSTMAVKEKHFKRRLAYSTISNLSYILFGVTIMTPLGLVGALLHLVFHGVMKICSFFCAGAVICKAEKHYVDELDGLGRRMPLTFSIFTISAVAIMGLPGLPGFISKWSLAKAAVESSEVMPLIGVGVLIVSAVLTAIYMLEVVIRAFFPAKDENRADNVKTEKCDPTFRMLIPLFAFVIMMLVLGLHPAGLIGFITDVAKGVL